MPLRLPSGGGLGGFTPASAPAWSSDGSTFAALVRRGRSSALLRCTPATARCTAPVPLDSRTALAGVSDALGPLLATTPAGQRPYDRPSGCAPRQERPAPVVDVRPLDGGAAPVRLVGEDGGGFGTPDVGELTTIAVLPTADGALLVDRPGARLRLEVLCGLGVPPSTRIVGGRPRWRVLRAGGAVDLTLPRGFGGPGRRVWAVREERGSLVLVSRGEGAGLRLARYVPGRDRLEPVRGVSRASRRAIQHASLGPVTVAGGALAGELDLARSVRGLPNGVVRLPLDGGEPARVARRGRLLSASV